MLFRWPLRHPNEVTKVDRLMVSIAETCEMLSLGRTTIYKLIGEGRLEVVKVGSRTLVRLSSIRELVSN